MRRKDDILDYLEDMCHEDLAMFAYENLTTCQEADVLEIIQNEEEEDD